MRREQALAEMSAVLAHEIRTPLGSLELFAGLLAESDLDSDCRKWVEHVHAGLRTLAATVNNVLHFHSLPEHSLREHGLPEPERAPMDLGQPLRSARDFFLPLARQPRVTLSLQNRLSGVYFPGTVIAWSNNAIRARPGGGWIELAGRKIKTQNCRCSKIMSPLNCNETLSPYQDGDDDCSTEIVNENHPIDARWPCQEWAIAEIVSLPIFLTVDFNGAESSIEPDHRPLPFVLGVGIQIAFLSACRARTKKPGCGKAPSAGLGSSDTSVGRDWCLVLGQPRKRIFRLGE